MDTTVDSPNYTDFNQIVAAHYHDLTKSEKRIADFIRKNQEESAFLSAAEIADRLDLSEATLVRFARSLNFESYPAMRTVLQDNFRRRVTHSSRLRGRLDDMKTEGEILERLTATEIDYLSQAVLSIDQSEMQKAVDLIRDHQRIFVFGLGPSISLVYQMQLRLNRFGKDVIPLTSSGRELLESLLTMTSSDLVFVICFFDQNPALRLLLEYSQQAGSKIIMLTDTLDAILGDCVDVVLAAQRGPVGEFHSLVVPMTVINALLLSYADQEQDKIMPLLDRLDELRDKLNCFTCNGD
jgi:DNA-binding MurR/RpiR family transcriptional regulator